MEFNPLLNEMWNKKEPFEIGNMKGDFLNSMWLKIRKRRVWGLWICFVREYSIWLARPLF